METRIRDCLNLATDTKAFISGSSALQKLPQVLMEQFPGKSPFLIADENTWTAAGATVEIILKKAAYEITGIHIFPATPPLHAEYAHVDKLIALFQALLREMVVPVSVGAGTINDLVKRAASEAGLPYLCVPTASSVDGYTSAGAALLDEGFKKTFPCPAPRCIVADEQVLQAAPSFLASSGFGDLAGKIIAGTDWIIAQTVAPAGVRGTEPIDEKAWEMTQGRLKEYLFESQDAVRGDGKASSQLFEALALTGFAMQYTKSSRPVSGCEHLFAHLWEMVDLAKDGRSVTHGHKVALGTLCAAGITLKLFKAPEVPYKDFASPTKEEREKEVRKAFAKSIAGGIASAAAADAAVEAALEKMSSDSLRTQLRKLLAENWTPLREKVLSCLPSYGELRSMLKKAGCPVLPEEIGLTRKEALESARAAQMIRNRYTVLDLAWDLGVLDGLLMELEDDTEYLS